MEYLKLKDLMHLKLTNISLEHIELESNTRMKIHELSLKTFSEYGQNEWKDIMESKVESYNGNNIILSGVTPQRVYAFHNMMTGQADFEMFEKCYLPSKYTMFTDEKLIDEAFDKKVIDLIAVYENMLGTSDKDRVTGFFSKYGEYYGKKNVSFTHAVKIFGKALETLGITSDEYKADKTLKNRQEIRLRLKENLMANKIYVNDTVAYATPEPVSAPNEFEITGGVVESIDAENKTCKLYSAFTHIEVPFKNIFARYNENSYEIFHGWNNAEILLDARESDGTVVLDEAKKLYYDKNMEETEECNNSMTMGGM